MSQDGETPILLTPGPLTTSLETRQAILRDWGSRDEAFIGMTREMRQRLAVVAGARGRHVVVPLQGSGTFIVEAAIGTLIGPGDKLLVLINGAYGDRMLSIAQRLDRRVNALLWPENQAIDPARVDHTSGPIRTSPILPWCIVKPRQACSIRSPRSPPSPPAVARPCWSMR